ncbi:MAG TPA: replication initiator protein A, partial [Chloroflexota bacterium]|nr:replication initiator protein A [Chloroflexota bacterium]
MSLRETKRRHNRAETEESSSPILHDAHLEAKAHALAERDSATEPSVLAVAEMNLEEYPAFRLGRRSKRPEIRYVRSRTEPNGRAFEQVWVVRGAEGLGLPGPFEQDLYVALLVLFTEQGLPADGRIRFTRNRLAQIMNCSNSGRGYELIEQGLDRLAGATIHTEHAFFRPGPVGSAGERSGPSERLSLTFHILEEVRVYERCAAVLEEDSPTGEKHPRVEHARPLELSVARLGLPLVQSYERRYTKGLDATFYFSLTRPLAKRLYRYVDKVRNGRGSFEIGIRALADVLGLEYRYPSDIKDGLVEAHAELEEQGFLAEARYAPLAGGPTAGEKVIYGFQAAFDRRPRRRAGTVAPPHQAELE